GQSEHRRKHANGCDRAAASMAHAVHADTPTPSPHSPPPPGGRGVGRRPCSRSLVLPLAPAWETKVGRYRLPCPASSPSPLVGEGGRGVRGPHRTPASDR